MREYNLGFNRHSRSTPRPVSDVEPIPTFSGELYGAFQVLEEATRGRNLEGKYRTQYTVSGACPIAGHCAKLFSSRADAMQDQRNIMAAAYNRSVEYLDAQDELSRLEHAPITLGESTCPNGCTSPCVPAESTQPVPAPRDVTPANVALLLAMTANPADMVNEHNIIRPKIELKSHTCEICGDSYRGTACPNCIYCPDCGQRKRSGFACRKCNPPNAATSGAVVQHVKPKKTAAQWVYDNAMDMRLCPAGVYSDLETRELKLA